MLQTAMDIFLFKDFCFHSKHTICCLILMVLLLNTTVDWVSTLSWGLSWVASNFHGFHILSLFIVIIGTFVMHLFAALTDMLIIDFQIKSKLLAFIFNLQDKSIIRITISCYWNSFLLLNYCNLKNDTFHFSHQMPIILTFFELLFFLRKNAFNA